jgi:hypothetical protein
MVPRDLDNLEFAEKLVKFDPRLFQAFSHGSNSGAMLPEQFDIN